MLACDACTTKGIFSVGDSNPKFLLNLLAVFDSKLSSCFPEERLAKKMILN